MWDVICFHPILLYRKALKRGAIGKISSSCRDENNKIASFCTENRKIPQKNMEIPQKSIKSLAKSQENPAKTPEKARKKPEKSAATADETARPRLHLFVCMY